MKKTYHALQLRLSRDIKYLESRNNIKDAAKVADMKKELKKDRNKMEDLEQKRGVIISKEMKRSFDEFTQILEKDGFFK